VEKIKAKIEFFKTLFIVFVTVLFSMIAYFFINFERLCFMKKFILGYVIIVFIVIEVLIIFQWIKFIRLLKD